MFNIKGEKMLVRMNYIPKNPTYQKNFVRYYLGGIMFYDHRKEIIETKGNRPLFEKRFKQPAVIQFIYRRDHGFVNVFNSQSTENCKDMGFLEASEEEIILDQKPLSSIRVNVIFGFFGENVAVEGFAWLRPKTFD